MKDSVQHKVSDFLSDRVPYLDKSWKDQMKPLEIAEAYGERKLSKLREILVHPSTGKDEIEKTLLVILDLDLSYPNMVIELIEEGFSSIFTDILERFAQQTDMTLERLTRIIHFFARQYQGILAFEKHDTISHLLNLLKETKNFNVSCEIMETIFDASSTRNGLILLGKYKTVSYIVEYGLIHNNNLDTNNNSNNNNNNRKIINLSIEALRRLSELDSNLIQTLNSGIVRKLRQYFSFSLDRDIILKALTLTSGLAKHYDGKVLMEKLGYVELMNNFLISETPGPAEKPNLILLEVLKILMFLSINVEAKFKCFQIKPLIPKLKELVSILNVNDNKLEITYCNSCLKNIAEYPAASKIIL